MILYTLYLPLIESKDGKKFFEEIFKTYHLRMLHIANSILHNPDDAEDAIQNAFINVAKNIEKIQELNEHDQFSYLYKIAQNSAIDIARKRNGKEIKYSFEENTYKEITDNTFIESLEIKNNYDAVIAAIKDLDDIYRIVIHFHFINGYSTAEIAKILGIKVSTVKQRLVRGKKLLLQKLGELKNDN